MRNSTIGVEWRAVSCTPPAQPPPPVESALPVLLGILRGTCGSACSVDSVRDNSGKAFVALAEVFQGGQLVHDDVELVLKLAKMKPLS